ncbi:hypothetical protein [Symbiobacterium terraclitae]|uniref:hypothetical protein n=1 Tax=Symbiobacterium terraclitae TaxID=557451 RepID=UPI0035B520E7
MSAVEQRLREIQERVSKASEGPWYVQSPRVASVADGRWEENAEFIAHAREDVPWLLSLLREREEEIRQLRARLIFVHRGYWPYAWNSVPEEIRQECLDAALRGEQP